MGIGSTCTSSPINPPTPTIKLPTIITDLIRCNTDAAWKVESGAAGQGWIFSDATTPEIDCRSLYKKHVSFPLLVEALAIREALMHVISLNINHIWVRSDSKCSSDQSTGIKDRRSSIGHRRFIFFLHLLFFLLYF